MKKIVILFICLTALAIPAQGPSEENTNIYTSEIPDFEMGVIIGEPLGVTLKWWNSRRSAFDIAAAWSFTENGIFEIYANYLFHYLFLKNDLMPLYVGIGGSFRIDGDSFIGARFPLGVEYFVPGLPLSLYAEAGPIWQFAPRNEAIGMGGVGIRVTFGTL